ncbi:tail fiber protein [Bradyrhizobium sp. Arg237L]|uniref:tail fiber protein n=1 Tax=Bradyrhizobium sp. Arg237L TaxID=3003352 RepID=UPI00249E8309|nr:tail fiber protein [Bradyrhizobium sp. Arg237L]MDI4231463.1 tail fiber protein [Bradyrhizobium sp. Arg237L]
MAFVRPRARILELSTTAGNGPYALAGAADNSYNTFSAFMSIGDTTYATIVEPGVAFWAGLVTYSAANQITLTDVEESKGTFGNGTKEIFASRLASDSAFPQDVSGAIVTGGTATAYAVASFRKYDTLARLSGNIIAFTPHVTNAANATLSVDGLAAKPLRLAPGMELQSNTLIQGTPYTALYNNSDGAFYLHGLGGNAYGIPLGSGMDYWGPTTPSSAFAFPVGQALSRTVYASLFALFGTTYGAVDGSTFNLPDLRGRVVAAMDNMGGAAIGRLSFATGRGAVGGAQSVALTAANIPTITSSVSVSVSGSISGATNQAVHITGAGSRPADVGVGIGEAVIGVSGSFSGSGSGSATSNNTGGGAAHDNVQPTIAAGYILRVL